MDNSVTSFTVATLGLSEIDMRMVSDTLAGTQNRTPSFRQCDATEEMAPHIVIVRAGSPPANRDWEAYQGSFGSDVVVSLIALGAGPMRRPPLCHSVSTLSSASLLPLLDRIVAEEHGWSGDAGTAPKEDSPPAEPHSKAIGAALAVDAGLPVRSQLKMGLAGLMQRVDFAATRELALKLAEEHQYDIIFVDAQMPQTDSSALCKAIKADPKNTTQLVMLCNSSCSEEQARIEFADFDNYITKPLRQTMLKERVLECLCRRSAD